MIIVRRLEAIVEAVFSGNVSEAALAADIPVPTLHRILDGSVENPRLSTLRRLAEAFGVPLGWILGDMTTLEAQGLGPGIPEAVWLILMYHLQRQNRLRERIRNTEVKTTDAQRLKEEFADFNFLPFASATPLMPALDYLSIQLDTKIERDLALIRRWAALSTAFLECALTKIKSLERTR